MKLPSLTLLGFFFLGAMFGGYLMVEQMDAIRLEGITMAECVFRYLSIGLLASACAHLLILAVAYLFTCLRLFKPETKGGLLLWSMIIGGISAVCILKLLQSSFLSHQTSTSSGWELQGWIVICCGVQCLCFLGSLMYWSRKYPHLFKAGE